MPYFLTLFCLFLLMPHSASAWFLEEFEVPAVKPPPVKVPVRPHSAATVSTYTDPTTGMEFVFVKGGCYQMGSNDGEPDEKPVHEVCVDDFYLGKYEVTVGQFRKFVDATSYRTEAEKDGGSYIYTGSKWEKKGGVNWRHDVTGDRQAGEDHPVIHVSWNDAERYLQWVSGRGSKNYRLPTEAEWEYAASSGGKSEKWAGTSSESSLGDYAWYDKNSGNQTHPVGQKRPNGLGLYDMSGNVYEWCSDWYHGGYYGKSLRSNPQGPSSGSLRVARGGSWRVNSRRLRSAGRYRDGPDGRSFYLGFRLVLPTVQ